MASYNCYALDKNGNPLFANGKPDLKNGDVYVSISQILSMENPGDFLIPWALKTFRSLDEYNGYMEKVSELGTAIHHYIEHDLKNQEYPYPITAEMLPGIEQYHLWKNQHEVEVIASEKILHSKKLKIAGTLDAALRIDGKLYFTDFKTGTVYNKAFVQLVAYKYMAKEMGFIKESEEAGLLVIGGKDSKSKLADGGEIVMHTLETMYEDAPTEEELFAQFMCLRYLWFIKNARSRKFEPVIKGMREALDPMIERFKDSFNVTKQLKGKIK